MMKNKIIALLRILQTSSGYNYTYNKRRIETMRAET